MLTKNDLEAIKHIVDEQFTEGVKREVTPLIDKTLDKKLKPIERDIKKIKKDVATIIDHFDKRNIDLQKRVTRIEEHLVLTPQ